MNRSEAAIRELLFCMGFHDVRYEPDGNIPPDFVVNDEIAVEVRRLNQNFTDESGARGLEEDSIPLWQKMERLVHGVAPTNGNSWFVWFNFGRPVPPWKSLEPMLREALHLFIASPKKNPHIIYSTRNFHVEVVEASKPLETFFRMGGMSDRQAGGWVVAEIIKNIEHCALEKLRKIEPYRVRYKTWWLALTNHTGFRLDKNDVQQLQEHFRRPAGWDNILLIKPSDPEEWIVL